MSQVDVAELVADLVAPSLEVGGVNLDGCATLATRQVVMVRVDHTASIEALTPVRHDDVHVTVRDELLQLGVDGGERDMAAVALDERVKVLGADESRHQTQHTNDFTALRGVSRGSHDLSLPVTRLLSVIIPSTILRMIPIKTVLAVGLATVTLAVGVVTVTLATANGPAAAKPVIVAGVSEWGALAQQLVGRDAVVVSLLNDPNADPHEHEATVSDAANVARAALVIENGAGYDSWLVQLVKGSATKASVVNVAALMNVSTGHNPHLFYSPIAAIRFVKKLTSVLEHRRGFKDLKARSLVLLAALNATQATVVAIAKVCRQVNVAATEDVTTYLLKDAGLDVVTPESLRLAIGNGVDPSVHDFATALEQLKHHPAFLVDNVQTATPLTNEIAARATASHVPIIKVSETLKGHDYVAFLNGVIMKIRTALKAQGCVR